MQLLDTLNDEQRRAVTTNARQVSIVAGPGTGKTKTLTARIAYLLQAGVRPEELVALTFTNKAAREISERVGRLAGTAAGRVRITTFHGLCYELLRQDYGDALNIISETDQLAVVRDLKKSVSLKDVTARELLGRISWAKSLPPSKQVSDAALVAAVKKYDEALQQKGLLDFDDLLLKAYAYLKAATLQISHVLVDEFQDTSQLQYDILLRLGARNLLVIGDPRQSIYGFRGASGKVFQRFARDFPDAEHITLGINYRSASKVVHLGNAIFPAAPELQPYHTSNGVAQAVEVLNEYGEAEWIINRIEQAIGGTDFLRSHQNLQHLASHCDFRDFAVLYRTHRTAAIMQRTFAESGIPYQVAGEGSPYEQPIVKTIINVLRWLAEPTDARLQQLRVQTLLRDFSASQLKTLLMPLKDADLPLGRLVHQILASLHITPDKPALARDLNQFMGSLVRFDNANPGAYLKHLDDIAEQEFYDPQANAVTLLTIHAAKGLEFDHVFLLACEDGILPHQRPNAEPDMAEEKRLFYVAVTRARNQLDILHARSRGGQSAAISPFCTNLPKGVLPHITDPALASQSRRAQQRKLKRSQTSLF